MEEGGEYHRWNKNHRLTSVLGDSTVFFFFSIVLNINCSFKGRGVSLEGEERFKTRFLILRILVGNSRAVNEIRYLVKELSKFRIM